MEHSDSIPSYEDFERQNADIQAHLEGKPYIGPKVSTVTLADEFSADSVFQPKIATLSSSFPWIRRTRPDGSCLYRSILFCVFEQMAQRGPEGLDGLSQLVQNSKTLMDVAGFPSFAVEDMADAVLDSVAQLKSASSREEAVRMVEDLFNAAGWSDYIVSWCRLYLSAFLRQNAEEFAPFLPEPYYSIETFCVNEVEPTGREGDHLQLSALTQAIPCVRVHVEYVDASSAKMVAYDFESRSVDPAFGGLAVNLLYRPGHYDVLYSATSG